MKYIHIYIALGIITFPVPAPPCAPCSPCSQYLQPSLRCALGPTIYSGSHTPQSASTAPPERISAPTALHVRPAPLDLSVRRTHCTLQYDHPEAHLARLRDRRVRRQKPVARFSNTAVGASALTARRASSYVCSTSTNETSVPTSTVAPAPRDRLVDTPASERVTITVSDLRPTRAILREWYDSQLVPYDLLAREVAAALVDELARWCEKPARRTFGHGPRCGSPQRPRAHTASSCAHITAPLTPVSTGGSGSALGARRRWLPVEDPAVRVRRAGGRKVEEMLAFRGHVTAVLDLFAPDAIITQRRRRLEMGSAGSGLFESRRGGR
ncbi:hypothetical protein C8J57DRAFT_1546306 [Mycena rebaudengoi]|nr:hypothetical protein C8J57DRAFT_1546306 [Mycena rebaudengoi]